MENRDPRGWVPEMLNPFQQILTTRFNSFQVSRRRDWTNFIAAFDEKYFVSDF